MPKDPIVAKVDAEPRTGGVSSGGAAIKVDAEVSIKEAGGHMRQHNPDGTIVDSPEKALVRLHDVDAVKMLAKGCWLLNPSSNELHKVKGRTEGGVLIETDQGDVEVSAQDVIDTLLLIAYQT